MNGISNLDVIDDTDSRNRARAEPLLGVGYAVAGVALLIRKPIPGAILGSCNFTWAWLFYELAMSRGALLLLLILILQRRWKS